MTTAWKARAAMAVCAAAGLCWAFAASAENYEAVVTMQGESYPITVEVEAGEVTYVYWPGGGITPIEGAVLKADGTAAGADPDGRLVEVKIDSLSKPINR